jgi:hypothetical protein
VLGMEQLTTTSKSNTEVTVKAPRKSMFIGVAKIKIGVLSILTSRYYSVKMEAAGTEKG